MRQQTVYTTRKQRSNRRIRNKRRQLGSYRQYAQVNRLNIKIENAHPSMLQRQVMAKKARSHAQVLNAPHLGRAQNGYRAFKFPDAVAVPAENGICEQVSVTDSRPGSDCENDVT